MALQQNEARLKAVVETAVDGVILIDATGAVLMFNPACERLFGYAADEVIGQNVKILMPPPYRGEHDGYLVNYLRSGVRKIIGIGRDVVGQRKDGTTFPMNLSVGEADEEGAPIFVGIIHDLTERKRTERALSEGAARLRAVVETAVDGVILIDAVGSVLMFNPACERLFGYDAPAVIGQNVKMLMPEPYGGEHDGYLRNYTRTGVRKIIGIGREVQGLRRDGTVFPMDLSVGETVQDGKAIFVGIIHDLTERKRTQEQLIQAQKMETVGQLSGGIAHDFNNLLTVIIGNADVLSEALKARPDLKRLVDAIMAAGERGSELTQRLLAFGRRQTLHPVEIACNQLILGVRELLRRTLREDIEVTTQLDRDLWPAFADPGQLESAIINLALNAKDAMPGGGHLTLATSNIELDDIYRGLHPEVPPGRYVLISVTDTGEGMPPHVLERAFEPFFTTKEIGKGSGLGLSMVYGFVKQSQGHVAIYSEPGLGTTVRLYLAASEGPLWPVDAARPETAVARGGGETVLLAEDDDFVRSYAVACLESLGYAVIATSGGREALERLEAGAAVDILFTDIVMPGGMNGWELAERAERLRPGLKVLLTSGYDVETLTHRGNARPNRLLLNKPYRKSELALRLREIMET